MDRDPSMVRRNFINIIIITVIMLLFGCKSYNPTNEDIVGVWVAKDGSIFQFNKDNTFETKNLSGKVFFQHQEEYENLFFNETGTWELVKYLNYDYLVVFVYFNKSVRFPEGFATPIFIAGKGIFENKPPWYLYVVDWKDGENRYILEQDNSLQ